MGASRNHGRRCGRGKENIKSMECRRMHCLCGKSIRNRLQEGQVADADGADLPLGGMSGISFYGTRLMRNRTHRRP